MNFENGDVYPSISPFILDGKKVNGRHIDVNINYGFGFDGINLLGRELFAFDLKGTVEIQTVSGKLTRDVQFQNGLNRAYELLTTDIRYDEFGNRVYLFNRKGYTFPRDITASR